jgi:nucleotide-binding universal stress UspA family protein
VAMSTHGRGPLSRFWLGSVADALMRRLPVPLLLVRPQEGAPDLSEEPPLRRILIPLDGSALAEEVLAPALALGGLVGAEYTLLWVVRPLPFSPARLWPDHHHGPVPLGRRRSCVVSPAGARPTCGLPPAST